MTTVRPQYEDPAVRTDENLSPAFSVAAPVDVVLALISVSHEWPRRLATLGPRFQHPKHWTYRPSLLNQNPATREENQLVKAK